jgi:hypothetical protein
VKEKVDFALQVHKDIELVSPREIVSLILK